MTDSPSAAPLKLRPTAERPRERCLSQGAQSLSLRECLAILLGSGPRGVGCLGLGERILERAGPFLTSETEKERAFFASLASEAAPTLRAIPGLGPAGRARILAAFELARRFHRHQMESRILSGPAGPLPPQTADPHAWILRRIPHDLRFAAREWIGFVPWYGTQKAGDLCVVERGVRTHVNFEPGDFFACLLALRPKAYYLFHNHPSGDLTPSDADLDLTRKMAALSWELGIHLLAHGIVSPSGEKWI